MVTAAQAYDGGEGSAREFDCEPATRQATTTTSNERDYCCSHSQPASIALLAGVSAPGYIVGGSWPPAVEEMSRPLQGSRSGGVKTAATTNGQRCTRSRRMAWLDG